MKMNCQSILTNFAPFWYEAEIEVEALGISKENYNKLIETGGELPDKIMAIREYRKMSQIYEDTLRKSNLKEKQFNTLSNSVITDTIDLLVKSQKVVMKEQRKIRDKTFPPEYWINTSVNDVKNYLEECQKNNMIHIYDISEFMKTYLRGKKGGDISRSFITAKYTYRKKQ